MNEIVTFVARNIIGAAITYFTIRVIELKYGQKLNEKTYNSKPIFDLKDKYKKN